MDTLRKERLQRIFLQSRGSTVGHPRQRRQCTVSAALHSPSLAVWCCAIDPSDLDPKRGLVPIPASAAPRPFSAKNGSLDFRRLPQKRLRLDETSQEIPATARRPVNGGENRMLDSFAKLFFYSWFCEGIELQYELEPSQRRGTTFSGLLGSIVDGWAHGWWQRHAGGADGNAGCWPRCRANDEAFPVLLDLGFGEGVEVGNDVGPGRGVI